MPSSKSQTIYKWKKRGLIYDDYDALYETYIKTMQCGHCQTEFTKKNCRCLDHDHATGLFRKIVCHQCNARDSYINYPNGYSSQEYYQATKEQRKEYLQTNKQKILAQIKEYQRTNKDKIKEQKKAYYQATKEQRKEYSQEYYQANKEKRQEYNQENQRANKDKITAQRSQKIECPCGSIVCRGDIAKHKRSKKHTEYLNSR